MTEDADDRAHSTTRRRAAGLIAGGGVLAGVSAVVLAIALGGSEPAGDTVPAPAPTEAAASPGEQSPGPTPTEPARDEAVTEEPTPGDEPTTTPSPRISAPSPEPVDPEGDAPPAPEPAATLEAAEVVVDGERLVARLDLAGPPPARTDAMLLWSVELARDGEPIATITAQQDGDRHHVGVYDWQSGEQQPLPDALDIDGDTLTLAVALEDLPPLDDAGWAASTELDGAWSARVPGDPHDPEAPFADLGR